MRDRVRHPLRGPRVVDLQIRLGRVPEAMREDSRVAYTPARVRVKPSRKSAAPVLHPVACVLLRSSILHTRGRIVVAVVAVVAVVVVVVDVVVVVVGRGEIASSHAYSH